MDKSYYTNFMYVLTLLVFLVDFKKTTLDFVEFEMSNIIHTYKLVHHEKFNSVNMYVL